MKTRKSIFKVWTSILVLFALLAGCASAPSKNADTKAAKSKIDSLAAWKGEWQSFNAVSSATALNEAYKTTAEKLPNYTADGFKAAVANMYSTPIVRLKFDGSNTVLLTVADADGNEKDIPCEYRYKGDVPIPGFDGYFWHTFEAVKAVRGLAHAQYLIAFPPHRDTPEGLLHWHARFGAKDIPSLVNGDPMWWPTYTDASMTKEDLTKEFEKSIPAVAAMFPAEPFAPYKGKWINTALIYEDPRPAVQKVYEELIKEFAGKKDGMDFTKQDIIALAKKAYGTAADFTHLEFTAEDDKNELTVWKGSTELLRLAYKQDGANKLKPTLKAFTAADRAKAGKFAFISMTQPGGKPLHMHLWYGARPSEIDNVDGKPTCIPAASSEEEVALRVRNTCRRFLQAAVK
ncbi:MAG: ZinT/AdcA family metal-binding protein [Treponema sp.]